MCSGMKMFSGPGRTTANLHVKAHCEAPPDVIPESIKSRHHLSKTCIFTKTAIHVPL